jgi:hypothetical protein
MDIHVPHLPASCRVENVGAGGGWAPWEALPARAETARLLCASVICNPQGRLEVFAIDESYHPCHIWQNQPGSQDWSSWQPLGTAGSVTVDKLTPPAIGVNTSGTMEVFVVGTDNAVWHIWQPQAGGVWSDWVRLGAANDVGDVAETAVVASHHGALRLFAVGPDGQVKWMRQGGGSASGWTDWAQLAGTVPAPVQHLAAGRNKDGRLEVFTCSEDGSVYHTYEYTPSGSWSPWIAMGAPPIASNTVRQKIVWYTSNNLPVRFATQNIQNALVGASGCMVLLSRFLLLRSPPAENRIPGP